VKGLTEALNFHLRDDTGDIFCKVNRFDFPKLGKILVNGKEKESIFAIKGSVPKDFRMVWVSAVRYLGEIDGTQRELDPLAQEASRGDGGDLPSRRQEFAAAGNG
jgi:hypothetical protein